MDPATMPFRVQHFLELAREFDEKEFLVSVATPVLVLDREELTGDDGEFSTIVDRQPEYLEAIEEGRIADAGSLVFKVVKRSKANHFSRMISIGRSLSCDVVVMRNEVSKFHAYLLRKVVDGREIFCVSDGRSRNGTSVNRQRLRSGNSIELRSGDFIHLGTTVTLRFFTARDFYRLLRSLA
ncbi:MAG: FHA domain-containing protein [Myxococcota bacterium]|jgi:pSer/pThr/pTyr-binding forkhead associated (FHA) protein|nr:FHA domain-containing protein [Myxococcota bacterium]